MPHPNTPITVLGQQPVEKLLHRLAEIEAEQPGQELWVRYMRRHVRLYGEAGVVDLTEQGLLWASIADKLVLRDAWEHLRKYILE